MSNDFYETTGVPAPLTRALAESISAEFALIEAAFEKLPTMTANGGKTVRVNAGETALETYTTGTMNVQDANAVSITGGSIIGITDLAVADGGTGASTASAARSNLGLGTIATQDASAVAITGGTVAVNSLSVFDNVTLGSSKSDIITGTGTPTGTIPYRNFAGAALTPAIVSSGGGTAVYTTQTGHYSCVDYRCHGHMDIVLSNKGTLASGNITITGLPLFTNSAYGRYVCPVFVENYAVGLTSTVLGRISASSTSIALYKISSGVLTPLTVADLENNTNMQIAFDYKIA